MFNNEISYIEGGSSSGFFTVEDTQHPTRCPTKNNTRDSLSSTSLIWLILFVLCFGQVVQGLWEKEHQIRICASESILTRPPVSLMWCLLYYVFWWEWFSLIMFFFLALWFQGLSFCWTLVLKYLFGEEAMQRLVELQKQGKVQTNKPFSPNLWFRFVVVPMLFIGYFLRRSTKMSEKAKQRLQLWCRIRNLQSSGKFLGDSLRKSRNMSQMTSLLFDPSFIRSGNGLLFVVFSFPKPLCFKIFCTVFLVC